MTKRLSRIIFLIWVLFGITSCSTDKKHPDIVSTVTLTSPTEAYPSNLGILDSGNETPSVDTNGCIQPPITFSYQVERETDDSWKKMFPGNVAPKQPWENVASLPQEIQNSSDNEVEAAIITSGLKEIWINKQNPALPEYWVYDLTLKKWRSVSAYLEGKKVAAAHLIPDANGVIWASNIPKDYYVSTSTVMPILSVYDRKTNEFLEVPDLTIGDLGIPVSLPEMGQQYYVLKDHRQNKKPAFWIISQYDGIYNYWVGENGRAKLIRYMSLVDNKTLQLTEPPINKPFIVNPYSARDGSVYFSTIEADSRFEEAHYTKVKTMIDHPLFRLDPSTGIINRIIPEITPYPDYRNVLVDSSGNLWLNSLGWMSKNSEWYQIHQPPIFILPAREYPLQPRLSVPYILLESVDKRIWFRSPNGTTWLDPFKGEWCWFTTYQSNIVEDSEHNLWMIADNKLYKLPLNP